MEITTFGLEIANGIQPLKNARVQHEVTKLCYNKDNRTSPRLMQTSCMRTTERAFYFKAKDAKDTLESKS